MSFNFERLSVLIVEDTQPMRKILHAVLQTLGVGTIYNAPDGETGYADYMKYNPDIVVTDWHMPNASGLDLVEMIRNGSASPNRMVPIIMLTGYSAFQRVSTARDMGVTEYLVKPFTAEQLAKRIAHVINQPRDFIHAGVYFGPCRRRRLNENYNGKERRQAQALSHVS